MIPTAEAAKISGVRPDWFPTIAKGLNLKSKLQRRPCRTFLWNESDVETVRAKVLSTDPAKLEGEVLHRKRLRRSLFSILASRALLTNTNSEYRGAAGKISYNDLILLWEMQGGVHYGGRIMAEPLCAICDVKLNTKGRRGFILDHKLAISAG